GLHALVDPVDDDVPECRPQPGPVLALEVDVVDVLVALRRVLGVLQRPIGSPMKPFRMLLQPRVIGGALDREVERDLEPDLPRASDEAAEVLDRPEVRMDSRVAALLAADRPRAAGVVRRGGERVVPALPVRMPERADRRAVDDVET